MTTRKPTRTKKEAPISATTPNSVLTTGAPPTPRTLTIGGIGSATQTDNKLTASGTENKKSKIQIKKGPNGQEYEYEYVYYYYDDDDAADSSSTEVSNYCITIKLVMIRRIIAG